MTKLLKIVSVLALLCLGSETFGQTVLRSPSGRYLLNGVTVYGSTATNSMGPINMEDSSILSIQLSTVNGAANISNTIITVQVSDNASNYITFSTITLANTGTTSASCISNYTVFPYRFVQLNLTNAGLSTVTQTVTLVGTKKPGI